MTTIFCERIEALSMELKTLKSLQKRASKAVAAVEAIADELADDDIALNEFISDILAAVGFDGQTCTPDTEPEEATTTEPEPLPDNPTIDEGDDIDFVEEQFAPDPDPEPETPTEEAPTTEADPEPDPIEIGRFTAVPTKKLIQICGASANEKDSLAEWAAANFKARTTLSFDYLFIYPEDKRTLPTIFDAVEKKLRLMAEADAAKPQPIDIGPYTITQAPNSIQISGILLEDSEDIRSFIIEKGFGAEATYTMAIKQLEFAHEPEQGYLRETVINELAAYLQDFNRDPMDIVDDHLKSHWKRGDKSISIPAIREAMAGKLPPESDIEAILKNLEFSCECTLHDGRVWFDSADIPSPEPDAKSLNKVTPESVLDALAVRFQKESQFGLKAFLNDWQDKYHLAVEQRLQELHEQQVILIKGTTRKRILKDVKFPNPEQTAA